MNNNRPLNKGDKQASIQDVKSNASSELSERTRNEILGLPHARKIIPNSRTALINSNKAAPKDNNSNKAAPNDNNSNKAAPNDNNSNKAAPKDDNSSNNDFSLIEVDEPPFVKKIVTIPEPPLPTRKFEEKPVSYKSAETQTTEMSDMASKKCETCCCNHCKRCKSNYNVARTNPEETTPSELSSSSDDSMDQLETYSEISTQTTTDDTHSFSNCPYCGHHRHWNNFGCSCVSDDQLSEISDTCNSTLYDLPYQNNDEYLQLVRELEHKLIARNRERVRRTMQEFELRSRQNMNLEKPVYDCDCGDKTDSVISCVKPNKQICNCCCNKKGGWKQTNSDILQNEKGWNCGQIDIAESVVRAIDSSQHQQESCPKYERSLHRSHWQLDPRSGEWVKVSFNKTEYGRGGPECNHDCKMFRIASPCRKHCRRQRKKF